MSEQVQTGGLIKFQYGRSNWQELDPERKSAIEQGYAEADERKRRERKNKIIFWVIVVLILLFTIGYFFLER